jgi:hypothetical protein
MEVMAKRSSILEQVVDAGDEMSPAVARYILALDFPRAAHKRYERLSAKAQKGTLTDDERAELQELLTVDAWLSILQAKAKQLGRLTR